MRSTNEARPAAEVQADITCPDFEPDGFSCAHYLSLSGHGCVMATNSHVAVHGRATLQDPVYCEWGEENLYLLCCDAYGEEELLAAKRQPRLDHTSYPLDLFGHPNPHYRPPKAEQAAPKPAAHTHPAPPPPAPAAPAPRPEATPARPMPAGLTEEAITSFDAAGIEAQFDVPDLGEVWVVSERTGKDRFELTARDLAGLARVVTAFDGARVVSIEKAPRTTPA